MFSLLVAYKIAYLAPENGKMYATVLTKTRSVQIKAFRRQFARFVRYNATTPRKLNNTI